MRSKNRKKEIIVILLSSIVIALLLNIIASLLFSKIPKESINLSLEIIICLTLLTVVIIYLIFASNLKNNDLTIKVPLSYNKKEKCFQKLPYCPMSVRATGYFSNKPKIQQNLLHMSNTYENFFNKDMERFIDHVVQELLITFILRNDYKTPKYFTAIKASQMPSGITDNSLLYKDGKVNENFILEAPYFEILSTYGRNNAFIKIYTKYGNIKFYWNISPMNAAPYSNFFYYNSYKQVEDFHDYEIELHFSSECKYWYILSPNLEGFTNWIEYISNRLTEEDWETSNMQRLLIFLTENFKRVLK